MADLKTDFKDDILDTTKNTQRKYNMITNSDGTVSFEDATEYSQVGDVFGAAQINETNKEISGMEIGGRNLIQNTKDMSNFSVHSTVTLETDNEGFNVATFSAVDALAWRAIDTRPPIQFSEVRGKTVTVSLLVRSDEYEAINAASGNGLWVMFALCTADSATRTLYKGSSINTSTEITDGWVKVSATHTLTDSFFASGSGTIDDTTRLYIQVYNYSLYSMQIKKIKLELGNKATDWCLSDKDIEELQDDLAGTDFAYATMGSGYSEGADNNAKLKVVRIGTLCILSGRIAFLQASEVGSTIATIPSEYAPPMHHRFQLAVYGGETITIGVDTDGTIKLLNKTITDGGGTTYGTACWVCKDYN